jgi:hypothetical protein
VRGGERGEGYATLPWCQMLGRKEGRIRWGGEEGGGRREWRKGKGVL